MIKITYRDLSPGFHAHAEPDGRNTVILLLPGLTPQQRRAALQRIRRSGRMGHGPPVPALGLALALAVDRIRMTARNCVAVVRLHPAGSALPVMLLSGATVIYLFMATVHIHVLRAPVLPGQWQAVAGNNHAPVPPHPAIAQGGRPITPGGGPSGSQGRTTRTGRPSGHHATNQLASPGSSVTATAQPARWTLSETGAQAPAAAKRGSTAGPAPGAPTSPASPGGPRPSSGPVPGNGPGTGAGSSPARAGTPAPSPSPTASPGSGICVTLGPLGVCLNL